MQKRGTLFFYNHYPPREKCQCLYCYLICKNGKIVQAQRWKKRLINTGKKTLREICFRRNSNGSQEKNFYQMVLQDNINYSHTLTLEREMRKIYAKVLSYIEMNTYLFITQPCRIVLELSIVCKVGFLFSCKKTKPSEEGFCSAILHMVFVKDLR